MRLRPAALPDLRAMADVHAAAFDAPWSEAELEALRITPGVLALAAEDAALIGFILVRLIASEAEILTVAVAPGARRRGVGRALVAAALGQAEARGAEAMFLEVAEDNPAARALYAAMGFEAVGVRKNYYGRPGGRRVHATVLQRTLNRTTP